MRLGALLALFVVLGSTNATAQTVADGVRLIASNAGQSDLLGSSVAISGNRAIAGAPQEDGTWAQVALHRTSEPARFFGRSVAIDGDPATNELVATTSSFSEFVGVAPPTVIFVDADNTSGTEDGTSWATAFPTLQQALDVADPSDDALDEIWIAGGTYTPGTDRTDSFTVTGDQDGLEIYGGFAGTETSREERDPAATPTILSGDIDGDGTPSGNSYHVLVFNGGDWVGSDVGPNVTTATVLDGVTVTGGNANGSNSEQKQGGGLYCDGGGYGYNYGNECSPTLRGIAFTGNSAAGGGGAIYNNGLKGDSSPEITNATFTGNSADLGGGAIYNTAFEGTSSPQITNATFTGNSADRGGAIYNSYGFYRSRSSPRMVNTILWGNTADKGPQVFNADGATPTFAYSLIEGSGGSGSSWDGGLGTDRGGNLDADPLFTDASTPEGADGVFGTPDDGLQLQPTSPATDVGAGGIFGPERYAEDITTDLLGNARIQDCDGDGTATVSLGAYETLGNPPAADVTLTINGTAGEDNDRGWCILALPFDGATAGDLQITHGAGTTAPRSGVVQIWDDGAGSGVTGAYDIADATTALEPGHGFLFFVADDAMAPIDPTLTLSVSGSPPVQTPGDMTVDGLAQTAQWHLLGNPHPTSYRLAALQTGAGASIVGNGFQANAQIYDATQGAWQLVDLSTTTVAPWQGFFIERTNIGGSGPTAVTLRADGRTQGAPFIGTQSAQFASAVPDAQLGLQIEATQSGETLARDDAIGLRVREGATTGWDAWDASKLDPLGPLRGGQTGPKAIESRPWPGDDASLIEMPLQLTTSDDLAGATLTVSVRDWSLPDGWLGELTDTQGTSDPSDDTSVALVPEMSYTFSVSSEASSSERFILTVDPETGTLPVEMTNFSGQTDSEGITLTWETASETGNAGFEVQRQPARSNAAGDTGSQGGTQVGDQVGGAADWTAVGFVAGSGTTAEPQRYRFRDTEVPFGAEVLTYRLRQVDTDGTESFTDVVTLERPAVTELELRRAFPNPARSRVTVQFAVPEAAQAAGERVTLRLYDLLGRQVRQVAASSERGRTEMQLDVSRLASGTYFLRLTAGGEIRTQRLTVVR